MFCCKFWVDPCICQWQKYGPQLRAASVITDFCVARYECRNLWVQNVLQGYYKRLSRFETSPLLCRAWSRLRRCTTCRLVVPAWNSGRKLMEQRKRLSKRWRVEFIVLLKKNYERSCELSRMTNVKRMRGTLFIHVVLLKMLVCVHNEISHAIHMCASTTFYSYRRDWM